MTLNKIVVIIAVLLSFFSHVHASDQSPLRTPTVSSDALQGLSLFSMNVTVYYNGGKISSFKDQAQGKYESEARRFVSQRYRSLPNVTGVTITNVIKLN